MGLEYFAATCNTAATTAAATIWCVAKEGTCCGVCANTLASLGTRIGLTFTVFFATAVVVIDGAEAPFIFMTTCLQALAYILTVLQQGLLGEGISKFHAYYALFCSLGFLCPLSAASLTATHFGYGGAHQKTGVRLLAYRTDIKRKRSHHSLHASSQPLNSLSKPYHDSHTLKPSRQHFLFRSLGASPFFASAARGATGGTSTRNLRRPLASTDPFKHHEGTSSDYSPVLQGKQPSEDVPIMERRRSQIRATPTRSSRDEEEAYDPAKRSTPSSLLGWPEKRKAGDPAATPRDEGRSHQPRKDVRTPNDHEGNSLVSRTGRRPASSISSSFIRSRGFVNPGPPPFPPPRTGTTATGSTVYTPEQRHRIERATKGGRWRRYGMLGSNVALWLLWLFAFLLTRKVFGPFKLLQTNCKDPDGTRLLNVATIVFLAVGIFVFVVFVCNYYTQWLHRHLRRLFDYNRSGDRWTRLMLPAIVSGLLYATWMAFLWTAYELAAQPDSSLLSATEETATFPTVLSIALCMRPVADIAKALMKIHKRKRREKKDAARKLTAEPEPEPAKPLLVDAHTSATHLPEPSSPEIRIVPAPFDRRPLASSSSRDTGEGGERRRHQNEVDGEGIRELADSLPSSEQSSIVSESNTDEGDERARRKRKRPSWVSRYSRSRSRTGGSSEGDRE